MKYINQEKLRKIKLNKKNIFIVLDFDRTITSFKSQDSWAVSGLLLGKSFKDKLDSYYKYYRKIELDYNINIKEKENYMIEWYGKCMDLYYEYKLTKNKIFESVKKSSLIFREGAREFFEMTNKNDIPLVILSAGIGNVIEEFLKINNYYSKNIYIISNFIKFDSSGKMKTFEDKMIHTLNKNISGYLPKDFQKKIDNRKYGILVGDMLEDLNMISNKDNILTVGLLDNENNLELYKSYFDVVLKNEDATFNNINEFIK